MADLNGEKSTGGNLNGVLSPVHPVYKIDETLTKGGYAADAKATGDALAGKAPVSHVTDKNNPHGVTPAQIGAAPASHATDKNNPHGVTPAQIGAVPTAGGTMDGSLNIKDSLIFWKDNEGGNIRIHPPAANTYTDYWEIDSYDGNTLRIFTYTKSTNPNGGPGNVFPLTLGSDGAITVSNTAKTRANLGVAPAAESTASPGCYYRTVDGVTEWINPPMAAGTEYKTTERYFGKAVYVKLINYGKLAAANTTVTIPTGASAITNIVDFVLFHKVSSGNVYKYPAHSVSDGTLFMSGGYYQHSNKSLVFKMNGDLSTQTAVVVVKYTKD